MSEKKGEPKIFDSPDTVGGSGGAESNPEQELSPEDIERVMEKVQDIDKRGTAYTKLPDNNDEVFELVLKKGLLGNKVGVGKRREITSDLFKENVKQKDAVVHFNIVGRGRYLKLDYPAENKEIGKSYYVHPGAKVIIFDHSKFAELVPRHFLKDSERELYDLKTRPSLAQPAKTFRANDMELEKVTADFDDNTPITDPSLIRVMNNVDTSKADENAKRFDKYGLPVSDTEYGFVLSPRVAPRQFRGIVFSPGYADPERIQNDLIRVEKLYKEGKINGEFQREQELEAATRRVMEATSDPKKVEKQAQKIVRQQLSANKDKKERLLPVYDVNGNLHWPKQMSYEEVKQYVKGRDSKTDKG